MPLCKKQNNYLGWGIPQTIKIGRPASILDNTQIFKTIQVYIWYLHQMKETRKISRLLSCWLCQLECCIMWLLETPTFWQRVCVNGSFPIDFSNSRYDNSLAVIFREHYFHLILECYPAAKPINRYFMNQWPIKNVLESAESPKIYKPRSCNFNAFGPKIFHVSAHFKTLHLTPIFFQSPINLLYN